MFSSRVGHWGLSGSRDSWHLWLEPEARQVRMSRHYLVRNAELTVSAMGLAVSSPSFSPDELLFCRGAQPLV